MKRVLFIAILLLPFIGMAQTIKYVPDPINHDWTGYTRLSATKVKIGATPITEELVKKWTKAVTDTITLQDAMKQSTYLPLPHLTTTQINALTGVWEGAEVWDVTLHKRKQYNGTIWEIITTN